MTLNGVGPQLAAPRRLGKDEPRRGKADRHGGKNKIWRRPTPRTGGLPYNISRL